MDRIVAPPSKNTKARKLAAEVSASKATTLNEVKAELAKLSKAVTLLLEDR